MHWAEGGREGRLGRLLRMVWVAEDAQESSGRNHWEWFQETLARLPEIGTLFTPCRRDTSLSLTQTFSQMIYSKSTVFFTDDLQQIHSLFHR